MKKTLAKTRRRAAAAADRYGAWVLQLTDAMGHLETGLHGQATRAERAQVRRVVRLMLAAADGAPSPVLLIALLRLTGASLLAVELMRRSER